MAGVRQINRLDLSTCDENNTGKRNQFIAIRKIKKQVLNNPEKIFTADAEQLAPDFMLSNGLQRLQKQSLVNKLENKEPQVEKSDCNGNSLKDISDLHEDSLSSINMEKISEEKQDEVEVERQKYYAACTGSDIPVAMVTESRAKSARTRKNGTTGNKLDLDSNTSSKSVTCNGNFITTNHNDANVLRTDFNKETLSVIKVEQANGKAEKIGNASRKSKSLDERFSASIHANKTCSSNNKLDVIQTDMVGPALNNSSPNKDISGRAGRRNSVVAMSTRRMSLAPNVGKGKVRKTSFVPLRTGERRKSVFMQTAPGNYLKRKEEQIQTGRKTINVVILITEDGNKVSVDVDSILHSIHNVYPTCEIELVGREGQCLKYPALDLKEKSTTKDQNSIMPPRNESPSNVYNDKLCIKDLIASLKKHQDNVSCQIDFCRKMVTFAADDSLNVLLAKQEGISYIIKAMLKFKQNSDLVKTASLTLLKMVTYTDANCVHIYNEDGISLLIDLLQSYIDDSIILQILLDLLGYFAMSDNDDIRNAMLKKSCHTHTLTTMSRHRDDPEIIKRCCYILSNLVDSVETARSLMFIGGVHVIIGVMQKYSHDHEVLENGCRALGSFAIHDDICVDVVNAGAMDITLLALEKSATDENLLECVTWALACLTKYDESCNDMCSYNGLESLVDIMKLYPSKETVQEYGCWTICNFVAHDKLVSSKTRQNIVEVLLGASGMFLDNLDLQEQLFFTISECLSNQECAIERFVSRNGLVMITKSMSQYPDHCILQEHGCRIIGNVAVNEQYRRDTEKCGASKVVASAMLTLDNCEELQEIGCLALTNITANVQKNKASAVSNGCVSAVLRAMTNYGSSLNVVLPGVKTICNVIEVDEACYQFLEEDGLNIFSKIMSSQKKGDETAEVLLFAGNVISRLSSLLGISDQYLQLSDTILSKINTRLEGNVESLLCHCIFYENLLQTGRGYKLFTEINALPKVLAWQRNTEQDVTIQTSICKILAAVCLYDKEKCSEVFGFLKTCMCRFVDNTNIQLICCGAVVYIAEHNERCREFLNQQSIVQLIIQTIKRHKNEERIVDVALMAMDAISNKYESSDNEDINVLLEAVQMYPNNTEIQIHGCNVISKIKTQQQTLAIEDTSNNKETCDHLVYLLKKRRSNGELQTAAMSALKALLAGEPKEYVDVTKEELSFLLKC